MKIKIIVTLEYVKHLLFFFLLVFFFSIDLYSQSGIDFDKNYNYVVNANKEFEKENWEGGKKIVDQGLKKYPNDSDLKMLSGKYYHKKQQYNKARYELVKSLEQNPNNVDAKHILINVETETKRYSSAICYVNELLEVNPYWKGLWSKKIELYRLQGNDIEAGRLLVRLNQIYPDDKDLKKDYLYNVEMSALKSRKEGNIKNSIALRADIINSDPHNPLNYANLADDYIKAGDYYKALTSIETGLTYSPGDISLINKKQVYLPIKNVMESY